MELFSFEKQKVVPRAHTLLIKEFKDIWDHDKTKDKIQALNELGYIFFKADYKSVYLSTAPEDRDQVIIEDIFGAGSIWKPSSLVEKAVQKYESLQEVPAMRLLKSLRYALEQLMKYFNAIDYKKIVKSTELTKSMADAAKVLESINKVEDDVRKQLSSGGKIRGTGELGLYENPED